MRGNLRAIISLFSIMTLGACFAKFEPQSVHVDDYVEDLGAKTPTADIKAILGGGADICNTAMSGAAGREIQKIVETVNARRAAGQNNVVVKAKTGTEVDVAKRVDALAYLLHERESKNCNQGAVKGKKIYRIRFDNLRTAAEEHHKNMTAQDYMVVLKRVLDEHGDNIYFIDNIDEVLLFMPKSETGVAVKPTEVLNLFLAHKADVIFAATNDAYTKLFMGDDVKKKVATVELRPYIGDELLRLVQTRLPDADPAVVLMLVKAVRAFMPEKDGLAMANAIIEKHKGNLSRDVIVAEVANMVRPKDPQFVNFVKRSDALHESTHLEDVERNLRLASVFYIHADDPALILKDVRNKAGSMLADTMEQVSHKRTTLIELKHKETAEALLKRLESARTIPSQPQEDVTLAQMKYLIEACESIQTLVRDLDSTKREDWQKLLDLAYAQALAIEYPRLIEPRDLPNKQRREAAQRLMLAMRLMFERAGGPTLLDNQGLSVANPQYEEAMRASHNISKAIRDANKPGAPVSIVEGANWASEALVRLFTQVDLDVLTTGTDADKAVAKKAFVIADRVTKSLDKNLTADKKMPFEVALAFVNVTLPEDRALPSAEAATVIGVLDEVSARMNKATLSAEEIAAVKAEHAMLSELVPIVHAADALLLAQAFDASLKAVEAASASATRPPTLDGFIKLCQVMQKAYARPLSDANKTIALQMGKDLWHVAKDLQTMEPERSAFLVMMIGKTHAVLHHAASTDAFEKAVAMSIALLDVHGLEVARIADLKAHIAKNAAVVSKNISAQNLAEKQLDMVFAGVSAYMAIGPHIPMSQILPTCVGGNAQAPFLGEGDGYARCVSQADATSAPEFRCVKIAPYDFTEVKKMGTGAHNENIPQQILAKAPADFSVVTADSKLDACKVESMHSGIFFPGFEARMTERCPSDFMASHQTLQAAQHFGVAACDVRGPTLHSALMSACIILDEDETKQFGADGKTTPVSGPLLDNKCKLLWKKDKEPDGKYTVTKVVQP